MSLGHWFSNAIKSAGHLVGSLKHLVESSTGAITGALSAAGIAVPAGITAAVGTIAATAGSVAGPVAALANQAGPLLQASPILQAARQMVPPEGLKGYDAAVALMAHPGDTAVFNKVRNSLTGPEKQAFDTAVAAHIGTVAHDLPVNVTLAEQAAVAITKGLQGATPDQKEAIVAAVAETSAGAAGVKTALDHIAKNQLSWWEKLVRFLDL